MEFCPLCMLRKGLAGGVESGESSGCEDTVNPTSERTAQRFEHYELLTGEDGKPVELGRGAMGVTYKAFDLDLRVTVTLKSGILDPQGKAIEGALKSLGIEGVGSVRQGKVFDIEIEGGDRSKAEAALKELDSAFSPSARSGGW